MIKLKPLSEITQIDFTTIYVALIQNGIIYPFLPETLGIRPLKVESWKPVEIDYTKRTVNNLEVMKTSAILSPVEISVKFKIDENNLIKAGLIFNQISNYLVKKSLERKISFFAYDPVFGALKNLFFSSILPAGEGNEFFNVFIMNFIQAKVVANDVTDIVSGTVDKIKSGAIW